MKYLGYLLVIIHAALFLWAAGGFMEMLLPSVPWKRFTNPNFPGWLLIFHWGSVVFASSVFLYGYFTHWESTPQLMTFAYGLMALICVTETFGYMTSSTKYLAMGLEFITYALILWLLFRSRYFVNYFYIGSK